jgi:hypothetical protein
MSVTNVINSIFYTSWGIGRWLRLGIGIAFLVDAFYKESGMVAIMGSFLVYQASFNTGCGLGNSSCSPTQSKSNTPDITHNFIYLNKKK